MNNPIRFLSLSLIFLESNSTYQPHKLSRFDLSSANPKYNFYHRCIEAALFWGARSLQSGCLSHNTGVGPRNKAEGWLAQSVSRQTRHWRLFLSLYPKAPLTDSSQSQFCVYVHGHVSRFVRNTLLKPQLQKRNRKRVLLTWFYAILTSMGWWANG